MSEARGHWYLLTGMVLGILLGLAVAWAIPSQTSETFPASLRADFKDEYRYMIAASYTVTGNLGRARARLDLLDQNPVQALGDQSQRMLANNAAPDVVRSMGNLSQALQLDVPTAPPTQEAATPVPPLPSPTFVEATATSDASALPPSATVAAETAVPTLGITPTLAATSTLPPVSAFTVAPRPSHTPTFTPGPPFNITQQKTFCEVDHPGLLQIFLVDSNNQPEAGVEIVITWTGGEEHFFSGLKPEMGKGYADFVMSPNVEYALSMSNGGTRVTGIRTPACATEDGNAYPGGIRLDFKRP